MAARLCLYIEDRPCAFWIGWLRDGIFYSDFLGYDPDRAEYSPGMYLVINVLEELFGPKNPASALDFGGGEGDWKAILSNRSWREAPVHVFAPTFRGLYLNFLWSAPAMINVWAKNILNRTNLMARVKKKWRAKRAYKER